MGQRAGQLADDDFGGLARRGAGPRSDAAALCENTHPATVFDITTGATGQGCLALPDPGKFEPEGRLMARKTRLLLSCCAMLLATACTRVVDGEALPAFGALPLDVLDVSTVLLDQSRMRSITGSGEHLTIIPSMDGRYPVDIEDLAATAPAECRFVFAETATFGPEVKSFHKTTFQDPPGGRLISEGAASYHDADIARRAFEGLVSTVKDCADSSMGWLFVNSWETGPDSLRMRPGSCGRDYRVLSVALLEVTFCGFPESVSEIVMTNIAKNVPGG